MMEAGSQDTSARFIEGLKELREGLKLNLIATGIALIGAIIVIGVMLTAFGTIFFWGSATGQSLNIENPDELFNAIGLTTIVLLVIVLLASFIVYLLSLIKIKDGMIKISEVYSDVSIGATGAKLMYYGVILMIIGILLILVIIGIVPILIGALLLLIGFILWLVGVINLDNHIGEDIKMPAILILIGFILSLVNVPLIGFILELVGIYMMYTRLGDEINRLESKAYTAETGGSEPPGESSAGL